MWARILKNPDADPTAGGSEEEGVGGARADPAAEIGCVEGHPEVPPSAGRWVRTKEEK